MIVCAKLMHMPRGEAGWLIEIKVWQKEKNTQNIE